VDPAGNVYVSDNSCRILKVAPGGFVSTLAGQAGVLGSADGIGAAATFSYADPLAVDATGNVYAADTLNGVAIRKITPAGAVTTIAGRSGVYGSSDGMGTAAQFGGIYAMAVDASGTVFATDSSNDTVRKITPDGVVTTFAGSPGIRGSADGTGSTARFFDPRGIAVDQNGNVYVVDASNYTIRKITPAGAVTTLAGNAGVAGTADGTATTAYFSEFVGPMTIDPSGNLYVADFGVGAIREITPSGMVTSLFGGALYGSVEPGAAAAGIGLGNLAADPEYNLYLVSTGGGMLWKITPEGGVSGFVGDANGHGSADGTGSVARFDSPSGAAVDQNGVLYVADKYNNAIRKVAPGGITTTLAGSSGFSGSADGDGASAQFSLPSGVAVDSSGYVYVADTGNDTIRKVGPTGMVTTLAGTPGVVGSSDGTGPTAQFNGPFGLAVDQSGNVYVADTGNDTIRRITPSGVVTTVAGVAGSFGNNDGIGSAAQFNAPAAVAVDTAGNIYVSDTSSLVAERSIYRSNTIRKITPGGVVSTLAGAPLPVDIVGDPVQPPPSQFSADGVGTAARFNSPCGIAVDSGGNVFVADTGNETIRRMTPDCTVTTMAGTPGATGGQDGVGASALFNGPTGIAVDHNGNVYVVDSGNNTIRVGAYNTAPSVRTEPSASSAIVYQTISNGSTIVFSAPTNGNPSPTYQWYFGGKPVKGATLPSLVVNGATESNAGYYDCVATNPLGVSTTSATLFVASSTDPGRLINLSCRSQVGTGANVLTAGFVVGGIGTLGAETLLIRASGPALIPLDVTGVLPDPELRLINFNSNSILATNIGWAGNALVSDTATAVGAFAWTNPSSPDSALVETLTAGPYLAQVTGASGDSGIALAEVYDATPEGTYSSTTPRLINISARTQVGQGDNILIAGFVIGGSTSKTVLIRASGPALTPFGVTNVLPDPQLQLYESTNLIAKNTGWGGDTQIAAAAASSGAFSWGTSATPDSAILITLAPGAYTALVSGASGDAGDALIEVYEVE